MAIYLIISYYRPRMGGDGWSSCHVMSCHMLKLVSANVEDTRTEMNDKIDERSLRGFTACTFLYHVDNSSMCMYYFVLTLFFL